MVSPMSTSISLHSCTQSADIAASTSPWLNPCNLSLKPSPSFKLLPKVPFKILIVRFYTTGKRIRNTRALGVLDPCSLLASGTRDSNPCDFGIPKISTTKKHICVLQARSCSEQDNYALGVLSNSSLQWFASPKPALALAMLFTGIMHWSSFYSGLLWFHPFHPKYPRTYLFNIK